MSFKWAALLAVGIHTTGNPEMLTVPIENLREKTSKLSRTLDSLISELSRPTENQQSTNESVQPDLFSEPGCTYDGDR